MNRQIVLTSRPTGPWPEPGNFELVVTPRPAPGPDQLLVRNVWLSLDPAMRGWVRDMRNYSAPVALGAVMRGFTVAEVMASHHPEYRAGDYVTGGFGWQEYAAVGARDVIRTVDPAVAPLSTALGVLGHTGMTAWIGVHDILRPRAGETVVVSTAAGAVGSVAGQLARIRGCRTVGLAGSAAKVTLCLEEFGYDACIDYRAAPDLAGALRQACPAGIDAYFDNTGGAILDAVLEQLNVGARIAVCGATADDASPTGPRINRRLIVARALMQGFLVLDHFHRFPEGLAELAGFVRAGRLRWREDVVDGLQHAPAALGRLFRGENLGKQLVRVGPDRA